MVLRVHLPGVEGESSQPHSRDVASALSEPRSPRLSQVYRIQVKVNRLSVQQTVRLNQCYDEVIQV